MAPLSAQWALWSKRPGSSDGCTVVSCSDGRLREKHFKILINRYDAGPPDGDNVLPRMTAGYVNVEEVPHVGLAIQWNSSERDAAGLNLRPVSFFCLPYADLAQRQVSYLDLYRALSTIQLPTTGGGPPIGLDPNLLDPAFLAADLPLFGANIVGVAAMLASGSRRICMTQAEHTSLEERLRFLDVTAALLPYGCRAKLTLGTWAGSATKHRLRLFFAHHAASQPDEVTPVPWLGTAGGPTNERERSYADLLAVLLDAYGGADVIRRLAARVEPVGFNGPGTATLVLQEISEKLNRSARLRRGAPALADLRAEIDDRAGSPERLAYLVKLMERGDGTDLRRIEQALREADERDLETLLAPLAVMAARLLWSPADVRLQGLVDQAARCGHQDRFLHQLIDRRAVKAADLELGLNAAARLLATNVVADPVAFPATRDALGQNVPVALSLILELVMADDKKALATGLELLRGRLPKDVVWPVDAAIAGRRERIAAHEIAALADHGRSCVHALLAMAGYRNHLNLVIDGFVEWVGSGGGFRAGEDEYWNSRLYALEPVDPAIRGSLDVLLLTVGGMPLSMTQVVREDWPAYQVGFVDTWRRDWPDRARMILGLSEFLKVQRWQEGAERADDVRDLMRAIFPAGEPIIDRALGASRPAARGMRRAGLRDDASDHDGAARVGLRYAARSDAGLRREGNADSAYAGSRLLVVADGTAGARAGHRVPDGTHVAGGDVASAVAVNALRPLDTDVSEGELLPALEHAVKQAQETLRRVGESNAELRGIGTTLTATLWSGRHFALVHIGDSRAYLLRNGELFQITHDHTLVQSLVDEARITAGQAAAHPHRSSLSRILDASSPVDLQMSLRLSDIGDRYLLCSDGLSSVLTAAAIFRVLNQVDDPAAAAGQLIELAILGRGTDNVTCVVADVVTVTEPLPRRTQPIVAGAAAMREPAPFPVSRKTLVLGPDSTEKKSRTLTRRLFHVGTRDDSSIQAPANFTLDGYEIFEPLGEGGAATVYRARQIGLGRDVAIKLIHRRISTHRDRRRFRREVDATVRLSEHPNVVTLFNADTLDDGRPYLVMELCTGGSLADRLRRAGAMSAGHVRDIGVQVADAVAAAHNHDVLHRDIKPGNLLVTKFGRVALADFGIAALPTPDRELSVTLSMTPTYAAPEVLDGGDPDVAGDIYALGATLYALLAGRAPYAPDRDLPPVALIAFVRREQDNPVPDIPGTPASLITVLRRALHKEANRRYRTAAGLRDALKTIRLRD
jgi:serine/threonine protein phosphatase PrpC/tRNA A-37 threonylcarbamoyl transferase component Bud32